MKLLRLLGVEALLCCTLMAAPGYCVEVGEPIPDFGIRTLSGEVLSRTTLAGRPLLLLFWNTWSPDSRRELPLLNHLVEKFSQRGLTVLAINTGYKDSERKARAFWKKHKFLFPAGYDKYLEIGDSFGIRETPTVLLVDAWGIVRYKNPLLPQNMEEQMNQLYSR
jgi:peroxiredoxin